MKQLERLPDLVRRMPDSLWRYLVAGGLSATLEYGSFLLAFYLWHAPVVAANTISFVVGLLISFMLANFWVFPGRHRHNAWLQAAMYLSLALFNVTVSSVILANLVQLI